jgi:hypothetical protein
MLYVCTNTSTGGAEFGHTMRLRSELPVHVCIAGSFSITGFGGAANGPGGLVAWASGGRLYRFFEVELHAQVGSIVCMDSGITVCVFGPWPPQPCSCTRVGV